jgi:hypothetical protein
MTAQTAKLRGCGRRLRAGRNERAVCRIAGLAGGGPLGRKRGRIPGGAAIGGEQHLVIATLCGTGGSRAIAACAQDPDRRRGSGRTPRTRRSGVALGAWRPGGPGIALRSLSLSAGNKPKRQGDRDQDASDLHGVFPSCGFPRVWTQKLCRSRAKTASGTGTTARVAFFARWSTKWDAAGRTR